ncbi:minor tail protein [Mycobacterium phage MKC-IRE-02]|uniref:Uncharacterized protein n=1 Tax=Mycobacterium phage DLane TaxID=2922203 RepID=G1D1G9_9CAUD|nr:hypothetical protein FGG21_gp075 [Mycobacterium phage DLane]AEK08619.1 hypothetical protein PBI_DLANE_75 [Mycobacterium phage DLane]QGJ88243.1 hypothetical protein PBI_STANNES_76 [Mycobacterium phage StAnnes]
MSKLGIASLGIASTIIGGAIGLSPQANAAESVSICPSGRSAVASADTSCAFADNVAVAWYSQPGMSVQAYSPVTGRVYTMTCDPNAWAVDNYGVYHSGVKRCVGSNPYGAALVVYVR